MSFGMLSRGSAESRHERTVQPMKSHSGRSSAVRLTPVRRVTAARTSQPATAADRPIQEPAIECGAASA